MRDENCVRFLQWALPRLGMRWPGFRKVRRQVCRRVDRRIGVLGLPNIDTYQAYLQSHPDEWAELDSLCHITISRFYRDKGVFGALASAVLPALAAGVRERGDSTLHAWSAGCASGEEPYTLAILWALRLQQDFPDISLEILGTDADPHMIRRARQARYAYGSLKELPTPLMQQAFTREGDDYCLKPQYRSGLRFLEQDIRRKMPGGRFDIVLCRNLVFTYFDENLQRRMLARLLETMRAGAALVIGAHEKLPPDGDGVSPWFEALGIFRKHV